MICAPDFYTWLKQNIDSLCQLDKAAVQYAILESCRQKAAVVASDERESGVRAD